MLEIDTTKPQSCNAFTSGVSIKTLMLSRKTHIVRDLITDPLSCIDPSKSSYTAMNDICGKPGRHLVSKLAA